MHKLLFHNGHYPGEPGIASFPIDFCLHLSGASASTQNRTSYKTVAFCSRLPEASLHRLLLHSTKEMLMHQKASCQKRSQQLQELESARKGAQQSL